MLFNKTVDLHFYTALGYVHELAGIRTRVEAKPSWFKKQPLKDYRGPENRLPGKVLKACPGIQDYYKKVIQLPLCSDLALQIGPKGDDLYRWEYSDGASKARAFSSDMIKNYKRPEDFQFLILESPWVVRSNANVDFLMCQPMWHMFEFPTISISQGVINFSRRNLCNVQMYVAKTVETQELLVPHGTPLVELIPLTDKKIKVHTHLINSLEYEKLTGHFSNPKFSGSYNYANALAKKCLRPQ